MSLKLTLFRNIYQNQILQKRLKRCGLAFKMTNDHSCEFCNVSFSKKSSLNKHQRTAKYCKKLQAEYVDTKLAVQCEYCKTVLPSSQPLGRHYANCIEYIVEQRTIALKSENQLLREKLEATEQKLWELTGIAVNKGTTQHIKIDTVNINCGPNAIKDGQVTELVDDFATKLLKN